MCNGARIISGYHVQNEQIAKSVADTSSDEERQLGKICKALAGTVRFTGIRAVGKLMPEIFCTRQNQTRRSHTMKKSKKLAAILLTVTMLFGIATAISAEETDTGSIFTWDLEPALKSAEDLNAEGGTSPFSVEQILFDTPSAETGTFAPMKKEGANYISPDGIPGTGVEPGIMYVSPGCNTDNGKCAAVAFGFTAPIAGTYVLRAKVTLREGNTSEESDNLYAPTKPEWYTLKGQDGKKENVHLFGGAAGTVEEITATYTVAAGETFYLVSDPNGNHWNDNAFLSASVSLEKAAVKGMAEPKVGENLLGENLLFHSGSSPVNYNDAANHGLVRFMGINMQTASLYMLGGLAADPNGGYAGSGIHFNNYAGPQVGLNESFRSAAIALIIPVDGNYSLSTVLNRVNDSTDGNTFTESYVYVVSRGKRLFEKKFWRTEAGTEMNITADFKAGDVLLIVSDPNGGENKHWEDTLSLGNMSFVCNSIVGKEVNPPSPPTGNAVMLVVPVMLAGASCLRFCGKRKENNT